MYRERSGGAPYGVARIGIPRSTPTVHRLHAQAWARASHRAPSKTKSNTDTVNSHYCSHPRPGPFAPVARSPASRVHCHWRVARAILAVPS